MPDTIEQIKQRLEKLDTLIQETKARLPAHSTKPPVMMDLLDYEDEYDALLKKLNTLQKK
jgi:tetrahydromethanopterin S-methyltransferase subunit G